MAAATQPGHAADPWYSSGGPFRGERRGGGGIPDARGRRRTGRCRVSAAGVPGIELAVKERTMITKTKALAALAILTPLTVVSGQVRE